MIRSLKKKNLSNENQLYFFLVYQSEQEKKNSNKYDYIAMHIKKKMKQSL